MANDELKVLEDIRKLLVFVLLKQGLKQGEVADALGVSQATISRMFSKKAKADDPSSS
ncbi:helix-turn-helix domain-containing protein [Abyssibius alkaniclasticus]|uniref:helix-turn-helix domain-containing protein n=1 Tax=Abyssibius alkaniclasticus TaxID=2881234 RepID=UPI0040597E72|tara:strand:+ start:272 stop:445 length:174 start_codon:yes stop_codon:yes gene_type:complete